MEQILHQLIGSLSHYTDLDIPGGAGFLRSPVSPLEVELTLVESRQNSGLGLLVSVFGCDSEPSQIVALFETRNRSSWEDVGIFFRIQSKMHGNHTKNSKLTCVQFVFWTMIPPGKDRRLATLISLGKNMETIRFGVPLFLETPMFSPFFRGFPASCSQRSQIATLQVNHVGDLIMAEDGTEVALKDQRRWSGHVSQWKKGH